MSILGAAGTGNLPNYGALSQAIRGDAGIPSTETVGPRSTPGLTDSTVLTTLGAQVWSQESHVSALASSGGGQSAGDPYIITNTWFSDPVPTSAGANINWADSDADYHIKFVNCRISGGTTEGIRNNTISGTGGSMVFENCEIYPVAGSGAGWNGITHFDSAQPFTIKKCYFKGAANAAVRIGSLDELHAGDYLVEDSKFDISEKDYESAGASPIYCVADTDDDPSVTIQYCEFDMTGATLNSTIRMSLVSAGYTIQNNIFTGCTKDIYILNSDSPSPAIIRYNRFSSGVEEFINAGSCDGWEVSYCEFNDNTSNKRQVMFNDSTDNGNVDGVEVHHCKFTKTSGTGVAGDEVLESFNGANCVFHDNWTTTCPEDAYEHVTPRAGCSVYDSVADNCGTAGNGQIVDIFENHADDPGDTVVRNIYGDCSNVGVSVTDCNGVRVSNVHVACPVASVSLILDADACTLYGPFENAGAGVRYVTNANYTGTASTIAGVIGVNSIS